MEREKLNYVPNEAFSEIKFTRTNGRSEKLILTFAQHFRRIPSMCPNIIASQQMPREFHSKIKIFIYWHAKRRTKMPIRRS